MYIKMFSTKGQVNVKNINVENYTPWYPNGKRVVFKNPNELVNDISLEFESEDKAMEAFERIFETLGMSSPADKTLDLTKTREEIEAELMEETNNEEVVAKVEVDDSGNSDTSNVGSTSKQNDDKIEE